MFFAAGKQYKPGDDVNQHKAEIGNTPRAEAAEGRKAYVQG